MIGKKARESSQRAKVLARDRGICARCGKDNLAAGTEWDVDHVVPVADAGGHLGLDNLRTLCHYPCHEIVTAEFLRARSMRGTRETRQCQALNGWVKDE